MSETRRYFLESIGSYLASLPMLSAWLARPEKPVQNPTIEILGDDSFQYHGSWETGYRLIRWIPVAERLPSEELRMSGHIPVVRYGRSGTTYIGSRPEAANYTVGEYLEAIGVTHFAKLPDPPSDSRENHTALYDDVSLSDSRESA